MGDLVPAPRGQRGLVTAGVTPPPTRLSALCPTDDSGADLSALRRKITDLVARNAVAMVQNAIDAVNEEGQYQAIKYLFEMIGLYAANAQDDSPVQGSLTRTLLDHLGISEVTEQLPRPVKVTTQHPVKSK